MTNEQSINKDNLSVWLRSKQTAVKDKIELTVSQNNDLRDGQLDGEAMMLERILYKLEQPETKIPNLINWLEATYKSGMARVSLTLRQSIDLFDGLIDGQLLVVAGVLHKLGHPVTKFPDIVAWADGTTNRRGYKMSSVVNKLYQPR